MRRTLFVWMLAGVLSVLNGQACADSLYRCADGTFTNRTDRNCAAVEAKAIGRIQSGDHQKTDDGRSSVAEVKLYQAAEPEKVKRRSAR